MLSARRGALLLNSPCTHVVTPVNRPGTSLSRPASGIGGSGPDASTRPVTNSGRPITGFVRPGTQSARPGTGSMSVGDAFKGNRPGTSRPVTSLGRQVRLGTASMRSEVGGPFVNVDRLDLNKYAQLPAVAKHLCDFLLYHDHNPRKALELAAKATLAVRRQLGALTAPPDTDRCATFHRLTSRIGGGRHG